MSSNSRKRYSILINLLILGISLFICLGITEVALRLAGYDPIPHVINYIAYNDTLGWKGIPNFKGTINGVSYSINREGFREREIMPGEAPAGKIKLLFLGDSFMFGQDIAQSDRVSDIMAKIDTTTSSYNFGISGFSTDQELLVLKKYGPMVKPDQVLLFFCLNDLLYNDSPTEHTLPGGKPLYQRVGADSLVLTNVPVPTEIGGQPSLVRWLEEKFVLGRLVQRTLSHLTFNRTNKLRWEEMRANERNMRQRPPVFRDSLLLHSDQQNYSDLSYFLLREIRNACNRLNARLILFTVPSSLAWTTDHADTPESLVQVMKWCANLGIETVDLFPVFHQDFISHGVNQYIWDKNHWNAYGNQLVAQVLDRIIHDQPQKVINSR
jgi:lysophospholipase L1-like esterase